MWISRILILVAVSLAVATDGPDEETAESQREARYAKNERPLFVIRPMRPPPKAQYSSDSSLSSTLTSSLSNFLPNFGFDWSFLGGGGNKGPSRPPGKVTYKILNYKKEPPKHKATPLSPLHTTFKADFDSMTQKKKYPAYNPKPVILDTFYTLPLKSVEPEPVVISAKASIPEPIQLSEIIVGKPSSNGVNIPPHIEASLIENDKGVYHELTGEINAPSHLHQDSLKSKLETQPLSEPYQFDFGGHDILDSKPISLSPSLQLKQHFKFNREEKDPAFTFASEDVINIVNPPNQKKDSQIPEKVSFAPGDAINIIKPPSENLQHQEVFPKHTTMVESGGYTHDHWPREKPKFASTTQATPEYYEKKTSNFHHSLQQTSPQTFTGHLDTTYEVVENIPEDHKFPKYPFLNPASNHRDVENIGIGKYMEDARRMYLESSRSVKEALKYTIPSFPTTKNSLRDDSQRNDNAEIITEGFSLPIFELPRRASHQSKKKGKVYQDREERYFSDLERKLEDDMKTDDYYLPKREPIYNKFYSSTPNPIASTLNFHPSTSISFSKEDAKLDQVADVIEFWPPRSSSKNQEMFPDYADKQSSQNHVTAPDFVKLSVNSMKTVNSNKMQEETTTEKIETLPPANFNVFSSGQYYLPSGQDFQQELHKKLPKFPMELEGSNNHSQKKGIESNNFIPNHKYDDYEDEYKEAATTENYLSHYKTTSTPRTKFTMPSLDFKESLTPKSTFFVKITTTSPPLHRRPSPTSISCERRCIQTTVTQEYLPVCGSDGRTYSNRGKLTCANNCGMEDIVVEHIGSCSPTK